MPEAGKGSEKGQLRQRGGVNCVKIDAEKNNLEKEFRGCLKSFLPTNVVKDSKTYTMSRNGGDTFNAALFTLFSQQ